MRVQTQDMLYRRRLGRRRLLGLAGGTLAATMIGPWGPTGVAAARAFSSLTQQAGFGPLIPDPKGRLALPPGFQYHELSPEGGKLSNGETVPSWHDGMAAFAGPRGTTILVRNHEITQETKENAAIHPVIGKSRTVLTSLAARQPSLSAPIAPSCRASSPRPAPLRIARAAPPHGAPG